MGSNGLTSARHDVFEKYLATKYPESFDAVPEDLIYSGQVKLTDAVEFSIDWTISAFANENLCTDYQRINMITGYSWVHCSGGAQTKILHFVENLHIIKVFPSASFI
jgi:phosphoribosylformylglycinamidine cyclo-ligase